MKKMSIIDQLGQLDATAAMPDHVKYMLNILAGRCGTYSNTYDADRALWVMWKFMAKDAPDARPAFVRDVRLMIEMLTDALRSNDWRARLIELIDKNEPLH